jgi:hypothetical protein
MLRELWKEVPGYGLLVKYLQLFKPNVMRSLPHAAQEAIVDAHRRDQAAKSLAHRNWFTTPARNKASKKLYDTKPGPSLMLLTAAWLMMDQDNRETEQNPAVMSFVQSQAGSTWSLSPEDAVKFSYVPRQVIRLSDVYFQIRNSDRTVRRGLLEQRVRRLQERRWWSQLGFKRTNALARQPFWSGVLKSLVAALLTGQDDPGRVSWRAACRDASRLVHLRYPESWPDNSEAVRNYYRR